jgi:predicted RNase H-like nuclease
VTVFIGLDLAWTRYRETGVCVLDDADGTVQLRELRCSISSPACFSRLCESFGTDVVVAIDAPLVVTPGRRAEHELARIFGRFHAGAYSANMPFLTKMSGLAGPHLAMHLGHAGFNLEPAHLVSGAPGRFALEVFPHPAHVELFGLPMALKYKKGALESRRPVFRDYQGHLGALLSAELPAVGADPVVQTVLDPAQTLVAGRALKNLEDRLDALTCAYVAYHCWRHGPSGFQVFGSGEHGCIVVPRVVATSVPAPSSP